MADYFFDTSALVKRHVIEVGSAWVRSLVHAKAAHDLYIARVTAVEVTSAITRRQHGGHLSRAQAGAILRHFRRHLAQRYYVIEAQVRVKGAPRGSNPWGDPARDSPAEGFSLRHQTHAPAIVDREFRPVGGCAI